jgi:uncharacterized repeat protein (TIGR02543 family)
MDSSEPWVHWFSDQTWSFKGYRNHQQPSNTLNFNASYFSDSSKLYLFIQTDDNTAESLNRDKFVVYFDVFPYDRGSEDVAYSIEAPTLLYDGGLKLRGPSWCDMGLYNGITAGSKNGLRTFEVAIPLSDLVPNKNNVNYRSAKMMIYLENYGDKLWAEHKVANYYPDQANVNNYQKKTSLWQQIDLTTLCPSYFNLPPASYSLNLNTVGGGSIVSEPNQTLYASGTTVQLTAFPNDGWQFSGWSGDAAGTANSTSITMTSNKIVTATFTQIEYNLTVITIGAGCSVTKTPNKTTYHYGDVVTLTPIAGAGYTFANWMGHLTGNSNPAIISINGSKLVVANFVQFNYTLDVNYGGTGTGQVITNVTAYHLGDVAMLMAVPAVGSDFAGWSGDVTGNANPAYLTVNGNKAVTATFTKQQTNLTVNIIGNGIVTKTPSLNMYNYGTNVQLTAIPAAGWTFAGWSGDVTGNTNPASINMTGNLTVYATFTQDRYTVVLNTSGQGNPTITPNTPIIYGSTIQLNPNPVAGWTFSGWSTNTPDITITNPSQQSTTAVINGPGTITAAYTQNTYSLTVNVNPTQGGNVTADNAGPYHYGDVVTLTQTSAAGYTFGGWSGDAQGSGMTCAVTIDGNKVVNAVFGQTDYSITVTINPSAAGSVVADKTAPYHYGDVVTLTTQPNAGYSFLGWTGDVSGTAQSIQLIVTEDMALTAQFTLNQYQLTVNVIGNGSVTKSSNGPYHYGDTVILTASPTVGWSFANWTGSISHIANPLVVTVTSDMTFNAVFAQKQYKIITYTYGGDIQIIPQQATYTYDTSVKITAVPNSDFQFLALHWFFFTENIFDPINLPGSEGELPIHEVFHTTNSTINLVITDSLCVLAQFNRAIIDDPEPQPLNVTINPSDGGQVFGTQNGTYQRLYYVKLMAVPDHGFAFSHWIVNSQIVTGNPLSIQLYNDDLVITPQFVSAEGLSSLSLIPEVIESVSNIGETINLTLRVKNVAHLWGWSISMVWDPLVLQLVNVTEGPFLSSVGQTLFIGHFPGSGVLREQNAVLLTPDSANGTGDLAIFTFKIVGYGQTNVTLTSSMLISPPTPTNYWLNPIILHSVTGAFVNVAAPPVSSPTAKFDLSSGGICYVGDLVTLDASSSLPGYDTLPWGHGTSNAIAQYTWSVDFGNDGTVDQVLYGEVVDLIVPYSCTASITLTVTAPDTYSPTDPVYQATASVTNLLQVVARPTKANIDVFTELGGYSANMSSDAYAPQELVIIYGLVTYNDAPVVGKDVVFEIFSSDGSQVYYRSARTDDEGIATIEFRLPWLDVNPEILMGNWTIIGNVDVSEVVVSDTCPFYFGYVVTIDSVETFDNNNVSSNNFAREHNLYANVTVNNIRRTAMPTIITLTVYDPSSVPIAVAYIDTSISAEGTITVTASLTIPKWAFVGLGKIFVNVYESSSGLPYCPEVDTNIMIVA